MVALFAFAIRKSPVTDVRPNSSDLDQPVRGGLCDVLRALGKSDQNHVRPEARSMRQVDPGVEFGQGRCPVSRMQLEAARAMAPF